MLGVSWHGLVSQKGVDLILSAAPGMLDLGCQLVFLGEGDPEIASSTPHVPRSIIHQQVGLFLGFDEGLAHLIEAGSDLLPDAEPIRAERIESALFVEVRHPADRACHGRLGRHDSNMTKQDFPVQ